MIVRLSAAMLAALCLFSCAPEAFADPVIANDWTVIPTPAEAPDGTQQKFHGGMDYAYYNFTSGAGGNSDTIDVQVKVLACFDTNIGSAAVGAARAEMRRAAIPVLAFDSSTVHIVSLTFDASGCTQLNPGRWWVNVLTLPVGSENAMVVLTPLTDHVSNR